jgi:predicted nucleic acid-binding protein
VLLVDTHILVDVLEDDPTWADWSIQQLRAQSQIHALPINTFIYAEVSLTFSTVEALDKALENLGLMIAEIPRPGLFLAGKAFVHYRRRVGTKSNVLADFFVGAHAAVLECAILTRDPQRYRTYFPSVPLITPEERIRG